MACLVRIILIVEVARLYGSHAAHLEYDHILLLLALEPLLLRELRLALERRRISHELGNDFVAARADILHVADLVSSHLLDGLTVVHDITIVTLHDVIVHVAHYIVLFHVDGHALHAVEPLSLALVFIAFLLFFFVAIFVLASIVSYHEEEVAHELSLVCYLLQFALSRVHEQKEAVERLTDQLINANVVFVVLDLRAGQQLVDAPVLRVVY